MTTYTIAATGPTYTLHVDGAPTPITASLEDWLLIAGAIEAGATRSVGFLNWNSDGWLWGRCRPWIQMTTAESLALAASIREATAEAPVKLATRHCPMCGHAHRIGPSGEVVCGGDRGSCSCDPSEPCRCVDCAKPATATPPRALDRDRGAPSRLAVEDVIPSTVVRYARHAVLENGAALAMCGTREMAERIVKALERPAVPAELVIGVALCDPRVRRGELIVERGRPRTNTVEQMGWFPVGLDMEFRRRRRHGDEPWEPWKVEERGVWPGILDCLCRLVEPEEGTNR